MNPNLEAARAHAERHHAAGVYAAIGAIVSFTLSALGKIPVVFYLPLERGYTFRVPPGALAMDWFGRTGLALAVFAAVYAAVLALAKHTRWRPMVSGVMQGWLAAAIAFGLALHAVQIATRAPAPLPVPPEVQRSFCAACQPGGSGASARTRSAPGD